MLAGIKPTVGRVSRYGVIPISADQDTPGPMAKFVHRCRDHVRRARGALAGSARSGDRALHAAARNDYTVFLQGRRAARAPASAFRARSSTTATVRRGRRRRSGGLTPAGRGGDGRSHRACCASQGADHRRSRRHPERRRSRPDEQSSPCGRPVRRAEDTAKDNACSIALELRHEARLQPLAGDARARRRRSKSLTELREWNVAHRNAGLDEIRPGAARHL